jgi:hypothetical protein
MKNISQEALQRALQMKDRFLQQMFPQQNNQELMQSAPMQTPQMSGYQAMNPMAMAQMLRKLNTGMPIPQANLPRMSGVAGMGGAMGAGLNPFLNRSPVGLSMNTNRDSYLDFLNSMSGM